jgi:hypothetical protein
VWTAPVLQGYDFLILGRSMTKRDPDNTLGTLSRVRPWLLVAAAGALAFVCIPAEKLGQWFLAEGACIGILFLLILGKVDWWRQHRAKRALSPDVETYYQALQYLVLVVAAGIIVVMLDAVRYNHCYYGIVAEAAGAGILLAGGAFMIGALLGFLFGFPSRADAGTIRTGGQPTRSPFRTAGARMKIFLDAEKYRKPATQGVNERSLPVFQALVEADAQEIFHRNRGQYALTLMGRKKDPKDPPASKADWSSAVDLLNDAIRIRERSREPNWREYELARPVCRIHLDVQFKQQPKQRSASEAQQSIRTDLDKIGDVPPEERKLIDPEDATTKESAITTWEKLNPTSGG